MSIKEELSQLRKELAPSGARLALVSKFQSNEKIMEAYEAGQRIFAESRPQELEQKAASLPDDIQWHFIGHLQSNKIKMVVPHASLIHSVDSEKLLYEIEDYCIKNGCTAKVLLEMHIAQEETKQGFSMQECEDLLERIMKEPLKCVSICGLMGMAGLKATKDETRRQFASLREAMDRCRALCPDPSTFNELSMGMSGDFEIAIEEGSTIVRLGSILYPNRS